MSTRDQSPAASAAYFADRFHEYSARTDTDRRAYVVEELRLLEERGASMLRAILLHPYPKAQKIALEMLREGHDGSTGEQVLRGPQRASWRLRLVDGVVWTPEQMEADIAKMKIEPGPKFDEARRAWLVGKVPQADPQGRILPPETRGRVLRAKVGNLGAQMAASSLQDASRAAAWSGERRRARDSVGQDLYVLVDVTREPRDLSLAHALAVLRQWGAGIAAQLDHHLVEEVPPAPLASPRAKG